PTYRAGLSIETMTPLNEFDIIGFSLHYELAYTAVLEMLNLAGIPLYSEDRGKNDPLVVAGGPIACNLEPLAPFFDLIMIGDGEYHLPQLVQEYRKCKMENLSKSYFLHKVCGMDGVYVPSFYEPQYRDDGRIDGIKVIEPGAPRSVRKALVRDFDLALIPKSPIVPNIEVTHDRMIIEIFRGCARGCRFCQAGFTYRPLRERSPWKLIDAAKHLIDVTGYDEIGLLSLSTSDYSRLDDLTRVLLPMTEPRHINLSLPSLRLDSFEGELAERLARIRRGGLTFAPEAGTQRLRDVINKNITEDDLFDAAGTAFENGWDRLKLYFMLGLPTETDEDVQAIVDLTTRLLSVWRDIPKERRSKRLMVTVSTSFFIPKPFTPFQWERQISIEEMKAKQALLADGLSDRRISYRWHDFESSVIEAVLARGDRRLSSVIEHAWRAGAYLDAWHEHFDPDIWADALSLIPGGAEFYTRERDEDELFPWEHLDFGVTRHFFERERKLSREGRVSLSCFDGCSRCGCDLWQTGICLPSSKFKSGAEEGE
ncbi:MAG: TIGR03960 family B12-binding radical SAM protein, partial [Saccharofermentanales bacterium]